MAKHIINGIISSPFGTRKDPINRATWHVHNGIDISASIGTPIYSPIDAEIVATYNHDKGGVTLIIKDLEDKIRLGFCHLFHCTVAQGKIVKKGQQIAYSGNSGSATTGAHLHFSLKNGGTWMDGEYTGGEWADPTPYLTYQP